MESQVATDKFDCHHGFGFVCYHQKCCSSYFQAEILISNILRQRCVLNSSCWLNLRSCDRSHHRILHSEGILPSARTGERVQGGRSCSYQHHLRTVLGVAECGHPCCLHSGHALLGPLEVWGVRHRNGSSRHAVHYVHRSLD